LSVDHVLAAIHGTRVQEDSLANGRNGRAFDLGEFTVQVGKFEGALVVLNAELERIYRLELRHEDLTAPVNKSVVHRVATLVELLINKLELFEIRRLEVLQLSLLLDLAREVAQNLAHVLVALSYLFQFLLTFVSAEVLQRVLV
jgi:hypothetical protein